MQLFWGSRTVEKEIIPSDKFYFGSHIQGSPFFTNVLPGAADYPFSNFLDLPGVNRSIAIAGGKKSFIIQAKDSLGNAKIACALSQGDHISPEEQFTVEFVGPSITVSGDVKCIGKGQYKVEYTLLQAGLYKVHVKTTGGTDIYCGLGEQRKCSPFDLVVKPGQTVAGMSEVESFASLDSLAEAVAGRTGTILLQARDAYGNNRDVGGDDFSARFSNQGNGRLQYRGIVSDRDDGTYIITYSIPIAGSYKVSITLGGKHLKYCVANIEDRSLHRRFFNGVNSYQSPSHCVAAEGVLLSVVHDELDAFSSTLKEGFSSGLSTVAVGKESGFIIEARDKFGNLRVGTETSRIKDQGGGSSDVFLVNIVGPSGVSVTTSSAVQIIRCANSSVTGYFRLKYGGQVSLEFPSDISASAMQVELMFMLKSKDSPRVSRIDNHGNYAWSITFTSTVFEWTVDPLSVLPPRGALPSVSDLMTIEKTASLGLYPVNFTLWKTGSYDVTVTSLSGSVVSGSSHTIQVVNGPLDASSSFAFGQGLVSGTAGEMLSFQLQARDSRRQDVQAIRFSLELFDLVHEVQRIQINSGSFSLKFRGKSTKTLYVGNDTVGNLFQALEELPTISVLHLPDNFNSTLQFGDCVDVEFIGEKGDLDLMTSSGREAITEKTAGKAPFRKEIQVFLCNATSGNALISYKANTSHLSFDSNLITLHHKISELIGGRVKLIEISNSGSLCSVGGTEIHIIFDEPVGDVPAIKVVESALIGGVLSVYGNGEENFGAVNGISPLGWGATLSFLEKETPPLGHDSSIQEIQESLIKLGARNVAVSTARIGIAIDSDGTVISDHCTSLVSVWSITFSCFCNQHCTPHPLGVALTSIEHGSALATSELFPIAEGTIGNDLINDLDPSEIFISLLYASVPRLGISLHDEHILSCEYKRENLVSGKQEGSFQISLFSEIVSIEASTTLSSLEQIFLKAFPRIKSITAVGDSNGRICHFDPIFPGVIETRLFVSYESGPMPPFEVSKNKGVIVSTAHPVTAAVKMLHVGGGLHDIAFIPTTAGSHSISITLGGQNICNDLSSGITIYPAYPSATRSKHDSLQTATVGVPSLFHIYTADRFGNLINSGLPVGFMYTASLSGSPNVCSGLHDTSDSLVKIRVEEQPGLHVGSFTPYVAGRHTLSIKLRAPGGLLATYFRNPNFTNPLLGIHNNNRSQNADVPWCEESAKCDSTKRDDFISFEWSYGSPFPFSPDFPIDFFSVKWEGEIKVGESCSYTFKVITDGGAKLTVGGKTIIDQRHYISGNSASGSIDLEASVFYSFVLQYSHYEDEAYVILEWSLAPGEFNVVPTSVFYNSRNIGSSFQSDASTKDFDLQILPGTAGLKSSLLEPYAPSCSALKTCSFTIQAKDEGGNNIFNSGETPPFNITIVLIQGLANSKSVTTTSLPLSVTPVSILPNDWLYIGVVNVIKGSTIVNLVREASTIILNRDDVIVLNGDTHSIQSVNSSQITLSMPYLGVTEEGISCYKASRSCKTGTYLVHYIPLVSGQYTVDVKLRSSSIVGFPFDLDVFPGDAAPLWFVAYGPGLKHAQAGETASFTIQARDGFGNNRLSSEEKDLLTVLLYPEEYNGEKGDEYSKHTIRATVLPQGDGKYDIEYIPKSSGYHTVAVVKTLVPTTLVIETQYTSLHRGGTFKLNFCGTETTPFPWDATSEIIKSGLERLKGIANVSVTRILVGSFNFQYSFTFTDMLVTPELKVETSQLIGNSGTWKSVAVSGRFTHINALENDQGSLSHLPFRHGIIIPDIQKITISYRNNELDSSTFILSFLGYETGRIYHRATSIELESALKTLPSVGYLEVNLGGESATEIEWILTFAPYMGSDIKSLRNFGALPLIEIAFCDPGLAVFVEKIVVGKSPFRVYVDTSKPIAAKSTVEGIPSVSVFMSRPNFFIQPRDMFSNRITGGPRNEVQIIETRAQSPIGGFFSISYSDNSVEIPCNAGLDYLKDALESLPGLGLVSVTSNGAKDLIDGYTVTLFHGLDAIVPSAKIDFLSVGDWVRLVDSQNGPIFSIKAVSLVQPYTIRLSSAYLGPYNSSASIFQHGSPDFRLGYQYIISFNPSLGDIDPLSIDGSTLTGANAYANVISCNENIHQTITILGGDTLAGYYYLNYAGERTSRLHPHFNATLIKAALEETSKLHAVSVIENPRSESAGFKSFLVSLVSFDGSPQQLDVDDHFLYCAVYATEARVRLETNTCPKSAEGNEMYEAASVPGRAGEDFVITLEGSDSAKGRVVGHDRGRYVVSYEAPRAGTYLMRVEQAISGGLQGEYYNNRWLQGSPALRRVDREINLKWSIDDTITPTGKDFVSVRWTGYLKPEFNEIYTFKVLVNDAARLWLDGKIIFDHFNVDIDAKLESVLYEGVTAEPLVAEKLIDIKIEFRENTGSALIRLLWESESQALSTIPSHRLFSSSEGLRGSPFTISTIGFKPSPPNDLKLESADWNKMLVSWTPPDDDGGEEIVAYQIEYWENDEEIFGKTAKQMLRLSKKISGGTFIVSVGTVFCSTPIFYNATAADLEIALESLSSVGDVAVIRTDDGETFDYLIDFLSNEGAVPPIIIESSNLSMPPDEQYPFCVCSDERPMCSFGNHPKGCDPTSTRIGTVTTKKMIIDLKQRSLSTGFQTKFTDNHYTYSAVIDNLVQHSDQLGGFGVRVSARSARAEGIPCLPKFHKPISVPDPPSFVEAIRDYSSPSKVNLHFTEVSFPQNKAAEVR